MSGERLELVQKSPLWRALGAEVVEIGDGRATMRYRANPDWLLPSGRLQGGYLAAMIDSSMAMAIIGGLAPGQWHTTIEMKVNYFRAAPEGTFTTEARVVWKGKNIVYVESALSHETVGLVAKGVSTCMVLRHKE